MAQNPLCYAVCSSCPGARGLPDVPKQCKLQRLFGSEREFRVKNITLDFVRMLASHACEAVARPVGVESMLLPDTLETEQPA